MFQNCINREILVWEEPLIGPDYAEMCKRVFEGMTTQVPIKFRATQTLYRTPIFITTNKDVWHYCTGDEAAFRNRMLLYQFPNSAVSIRGRPGRWWADCFRSYRSWCTKLGEYLATCEPDSSTGTTASRSSASGTDCGECQQLYTIRGSNSPVPSCDHIDLTW